MIDPRSKVVLYTFYVIMLWDLGYIGLLLPLVVAFQDVPNLKFNSSLITFSEVALIILYSWNIILGFCSGIVVKYDLRKAVVKDWRWVARMYATTSDFWLSVVVVISGVVSLVELTGRGGILALARSLMLIRYLSR